jgi:glycosyltransferase involved in cell wall biosynthesis
MRVLCVNDRPAGGDSGAEVHLELLMQGLRAGGDDVELFTRPARRGALKLLDTWDPSARRALEERVREFDPDVLHFHNVVRELSVSVLRAAPSVPRVLTVHDGRLLGDADGQGRVLRGWQRLRARHDRRVARASGALVLAVSGALHQRLELAGFSRVRRCWPWAAAPGPLTPPQDSRDLAFVGRLDPDKGVDVLVAAFLHGGSTDAHLLLAGTGRLGAAADDRVVRLGRLDRAGVSQLLSSVRAVVVPSLPSRRPEGAPLALIEALVHHRPIVVSDDPGCVELARNAGLVVPAGDVAALAGALDRILSDDALVADLSAAAAAAAAEHTEQAGLARVRAAYAEAIG